MESPNLASSMHPTIEESTTTNSTVSSPPDPPTPPHDPYVDHLDLRSHHEYAMEDERSAMSRIHSPSSFHHERTINGSTTNTPPKSAGMHLPAIPSPPSNDYAYDVPSFPPNFVPQGSTGMNERIPPLERASVDGGFWPVAPNGSMTAPSSVRRGSFLSELYEPQLGNASHDQSGRGSLPRILTSYGAEWPPSSNSPSDHTSQSSSHSFQYQQQQPPQQAPHLPPLPSSHNVASNSYYQSEQPPFYRRASFPISRDDSIPSLTSSSSYFDNHSLPISHHPVSKQYGGYRHSMSAASVYSTEPLPMQSPQPQQHTAPMTYGLPPQSNSYGNHLARTDSAPPAPVHSQYGSHQSQQASQFVPRSSTMYNQNATWAPSGQVVMHTDDAASKETAHLRRKCFNCNTTEPPSWRRSTLNPGKIVCNRCGLYERTHLRPRPSGIGGELRKAPPKMSQPIIASSTPYTLSPVVSRVGRAKKATSVRGVEASQ